jgi:threonine dehydrogenase-like Zn-dependent dehydrogenase
VKLAFVTGIDTIGLLDVERPRAGPDDVVLRVASVGICGSDLGFARAGGLAGPSDKALAIGHELSGTVAETGDNVSLVKVGDRVVLNPLVNMIGNGAPEGGFADWLLVRDVATKPDSLIALPDEISFDMGALIEPLAVAIHCINRDGAKAGDKVAIFGAGPIGLCTIVALRHRGITHIVVFDLSPFRLERARQLGASATYDPRETPPAEALAEAHGASLMWNVLPTVGTDLFIEASGAKGIVSEIIGYAKFNSRIAIVAIPKGEASIDLMLMTAKEMSITTSIGYPTEFTDAIEMIRGNTIDLQPLVSHRFAGEDFLEAFAAARQPESAAKVLVQFSA